MRIAGKRLNILFKSSLEKKMSDSSKAIVLLRDSISSNRARNEKRTLMVFLVLLSLTIGFGASNLINGRVINQQEFQLKTSGIINLTEAELIAVARHHTRPIYWVGPIRGYHYLLTLDGKGSSTLKYVPDSATASIQGHRQIATYSADRAWEKSLLVASHDGMSSFRNADGSLVFYSTSNVMDVFMAFKNSNYQIEIFDSRAGQALSLALLEGQVRPVADHETH